MVGTAIPTEHPSQRFVRSRYASLLATMPFVCTMLVRLGQALARLPTLSQVTGVPYLPITLTFPWLGLFGFVPLPTKWYIDFGEPILMDQFGEDAADNLVLVSQLAAQVRNAVQEVICSRLAEMFHLFRLVPGHRVCSARLLFSCMLLSL